MKTLDDGHLAITYEPFGGIIRALPTVPSAGDLMPDFVAVGVLQHWTADVAKLSGFHGDLAFRHIKLIVKLLVDQGYRWMYVARQSGRIFPLGEPVEAGDFAGMIKMNLRMAYSRWKCDTLGADDLPNRRDREHD
jgi:hypothetical protein